MSSPLFRPQLAKDHNHFAAAVDTNRRFI